MYVYIYIDIRVCVCKHLPIFSDPPKYVWGLVQAHSQLQFSHGHQLAIREWHGKASDHLDCYLLFCKGIPDYLDTHTLENERMTGWILKMYLRAKNGGCCMVMLFFGREFASRTSLLHQKKWWIFCCIPRCSTAKLVTCLGPWKSNSPFKPSPMNRRDWGWSIIQVIKL